MPTNKLISFVNAVLLGAVSSAVFKFRNGVEKAPAIPWHFNGAKSFVVEKKMTKRVVMVTAVTEDGCARYHHMGEVDEEEFEQLKKLQGSTVYDRQRRFLEFSVLARIYNYEKDGGMYYEDFLTKETFSFARVKPEDVCNYLCYHIIWEAGG